MASRVNQVFLVIFFTMVTGWSAFAQELDVKLNKFLPFVEVVHEGEKVRVQRIQDQQYVLTGGFARTSRKCPPFCIQPMQVAPGVKTVGELEVFQFMEIEVNGNQGILIDARLNSWYKKGTIPGSINIPFTIFNLPADDLELINAMARLGVTEKESTESAGFMNTVKGWFSDNEENNSSWDFTDAKKILLWCNGMWCGQSPRAIHGLLKMGYPAEKIFYYRGGMQAWRILGLTVVVPNQ